MGKHHHKKRLKEQIVPKTYKLASGAGNIAISVMITSITLEQLKTRIEQMIKGMPISPLASPIIMTLNFCLAIITIITNRFFYDKNKHELDVESTLLSGFDKDKKQSEKLPYANVELLKDIVKTITLFVATTQNWIVYNASHIQGSKASLNSFSHNKETEIIKQMISVLNFLVPLLFILTQSCTGAYNWLTRGTKTFAQQFLGYLMPVSITAFASLLIEMAASEQTPDNTSNVTAIIMLAITAVIDIVGPATAIANWFCKKEDSEHLLEKINNGIEKTEKPASCINVFGSLFHSNKQAIDKRGGKTEAISTPINDEEVVIHVEIGW